MEKIYTAFISSAFTSLRDERAQVIDKLLDSRILPIGMEHFTVSTNGGFSDIQQLIDSSDFFILLLGGRYGYCDESGISITEQEYNYALSKHKPTFALICEDLGLLLKADPASLTEDQQKQVQFCRRIPYARELDETITIKTALDQFLNAQLFSQCVGWTRIESISTDPEKLRQWEQAHQALNISGIWYHVHLTEDDDSYIRTGMIKIEQTFHPDHYRAIHMEGKNYNVNFYDSQKGVLVENQMKLSRFTGEYTLQDNGEIFGIYNAQRAFNGSFNALDIQKGSRRGIHDFNIDVTFMEDTVNFIDGQFHDEAPSPKQGRIFLFRNVADRNEFLLSERQHIIEVR